MASEAQKAWEALTEETQLALNTMLDTRLVAVQASAGVIVAVAGVVAALVQPAGIIKGAVLVMAVTLVGDVAFTLVGLKWGRTTVGIPRWNSVVRKHRWLDYGEWTLAILVVLLAFVVVVSITQG